MKTYLISEKHSKDRVSNKSAKIIGDFKVAFRLCKIHGN
jgi:hypothetical protein